MRQQKQNKKNEVRVWGIIFNYIWAFVDSRTMFSFVEILAFGFIKYDVIGNVHGSMH